MSKQFAASIPITNLFRLQVARKRHITETCTCEKTFVLWLF